MRDARCGRTSTRARRSGGSAGAGGASNGEASDAGDRPPEGYDAGPDAEPDAGPSCDDLDPSQPEILYLSADDSNSMASPAMARRLIQTGGYVPAGIIRTYEFLNYYNVPFEDADPGTLRIVPQMRPGAALDQIHRAHRQKHRHRHREGAQHHNQQHRAKPRGDP